MRPSDTSIGSFMSASRAQAFSSYGLIVGVSSVSASLIRIARVHVAVGDVMDDLPIVQPSGRYGVSSCVSSRPATASRMRSGKPAIASIARRAKLAE